MTNQILNPNTQLPRSFYERDTHAVAKDLLGKLLVRSWYGKELAGRICEVESYVGEGDKACHASKGRTKRTEVMFGEAGHAYVYLIYGMYNCLNIVTEGEGFPAAVLVRALSLKARIDASGPGKLTRVLHITRAQNGEDLVASNRLWVADDGFVAPMKDIVATERIGVDYAGEDAKLKWRYLINDQ